MIKMKDLGNTEFIIQIYVDKLQKNARQTRDTIKNVLRCN